MNIPASIHSIGHSSQLLQLMPAAIRKRAEELGIRPVVTINGIDHYNEVDLQRIREAVAEGRQQCQ